MRPARVESRPPPPAPLAAPGFREWRECDKTVRDGKHMGSEPAASRGRRWPGQSCYWWPETRVSSMKLGEFCQCRQTWGSRLAGMRAGCPARRRAQDSAALWGMVVRRGRKGCTGAGTVSAESVSHLRQIPRRRTPGLTRPWQVPFPPSSSASTHPTKAGLSSRRKFSGRPSQY